MLTPLDMLRTYTSLMTLDPTDNAEVYAVDVDLQHEAQKVVSIFQNEARMKRIGLNLVIGESIEKMGVTSIKTDPVRLGQVYVQHNQASD
jgi:hypothetical protein